MRAIERGERGGWDREARGERERREREKRESDSDHEATQRAEESRREGLAVIEGEIALAKSRGETFEQFKARFRPVGVDGVLRMHWDRDRRQSDEGGGGEGGEGGGGEGGGGEGGDEGGGEGDRERSLPEVKYREIPKQVTAQKREAERLKKQHAFSWQKNLWVAADRDDTATIKELIGNGTAKVDQRDHMGRTALTLAAMNCNDKAVKVLLDLGADPLIKDETGKMALDHVDWIDPDCNAVHEIVKRETQEGGPKAKAAAEAKAAEAAEAKAKAKAAEEVDTRELFKNYDRMREEDPVDFLRKRKEAARETHKGEMQEFYKTTLAEKEKEKHDEYLKMTAEHSKVAQQFLQGEREGERERERDLRGLTPFALALEAKHSKAKAKRDATRGS